MRTSIANILKLSLASLFWVVSAGTKVSGQSYLDKLESIVKQLGSDESPKPSQTEELPAPAPAAKSTAANPAVASNSGAATPPADGIYLGLEAENVSGGGLGVMVTAVTTDSPAWKAGINQGDRIMAVGGFAVANLDEFAEQLFKHRSGQTVRFLVTRGSRNIELPAVLMSATLAQEIEQRAATTNIELAPMQREPAWFGIKVNDLTSAFRRQFGQEVSRGAAVVNVSASSPARRAGIRAGDCIVEFASRPIGGAADLTRELTSQYAGNVVEVIFYRGRTRLSESVTLSAAPGSSTSARSQPRVTSNASQPTLPSNGPRIGVPAGDLTLPGAGASTSDSADPLGPAVTLPPMLELPLEGSAGSDRSGAVNQPGQPQTAEPTSSARPPAGDSPDTRVQELEREVAQLRKELAEKNKKIEDMERRLRSILESLGGGR